MLISCYLVWKQNVKTLLLISIILFNQLKQKNTNLYLVLVCVLGAHSFGFLYQCVYCLWVHLYLAVCVQKDEIGLMCSRENQTLWALNNIFHPRLPFYFYIGMIIDCVKWNYYNYYYPVSTIYCYKLDLKCNTR